MPNDHLRNKLMYFIGFGWSTICQAPYENWEISETSGWSWNQKRQKRSQRAGRY